MGSSDQLDVSPLRLYMYRVISLLGEHLSVNMSCCCIVITDTFLDSAKPIIIQHHVLKTVTILCNCAKVDAVI